MELALFLLLVIFAVLIIFYTARAKENRTPSLRAIPAFDALEESLARSIEAGRTLHLSLGTGGIATEVSADTLAGLEVLDHISKQAAAAGKPPIVSMADPTTMLAAQNILRNAYGSDTQGAQEAATNIRWISPQAGAYAAGVMGILNMEHVEGNLLIGRFGDEYLLLSESAYRQNQPITTVAGATNPDVIPYVYATSPEGLWGEEMFAAGAYLNKKPAHIGSLLAQDSIRWVLGLVILGAVIINIFI